MVVIELLSIDALTVFAQLSFVCGLCVSLGVLIPFVLYRLIFKRRVVKNCDTKEIKTFN